MSCSTWPGVNATQSTTASNVRFAEQAFERTRRANVAAQNLDAVRNWAVGLAATEERETARRPPTSFLAQAELMMPVPPMNRIFCIDPGSGARRISSY